MPTYQYRCEECEKTFKRTETMAEHDVAKPQCPKCGSQKVSIVPSRVYVVTSKEELSPFNGALADARDVLGSPIEGGNHAGV